MTGRPESLEFYQDRQVAERYHRRGGFAPLRKEKMLRIVLDLLVELAPPQSTLLELGAGTGLFTHKIIEANHFRRIHVTDGAAAMLEVGRETLQNAEGIVQFEIIDFARKWPESLASRTFDAVTSTMAVHHAEDKPGLFRQVFEVLKPGGVFVLGDHMAGASALGRYLIGRERALEALGREEQIEPGRIRAQIQLDEQRQEVEGNRCESVPRYLACLSACGFKEVDCLWQDYWLAVFVARKPGGGG